MTNRRVMLAAGLILPIVLAGCVAGYNSLLFTTKTNVGFIVDTKPPEVNLDIGRQELLFAPTYEEGKTPPVMASFRFNSEKLFNNYLGSAFATGDAAVAMSRLYDAGDWPDAKGDGVWSIDVKKWRDKERLFDSSVALTMAPKYPWFVPREKPGQVRPVLFGTDTSLGFKASWSGMESAFPDYVRLAYQRRELAFAAVTIGPDKDDEGNIIGLKARTPSLLATVDAKMEVGKFPDTNLEYLQYFASGRAATALAMRKAVRDAMLRRLDPEAAPLEPGAVRFNAGKEAEAPRARIKAWTDDESPVVVSDAVTIAQTLGKEAEDSARVAAQAVDDARDAQRDADAAKLAAENARAVSDPLCTESEAADLDGAQTALDGAKAAVVAAQAEEQARKQALDDDPTNADKKAAYEAAQLEATNAVTEVTQKDEALEDAKNKKKACEDAIREAVKKEAHGSDLQLLAKAKRALADQAMHSAKLAALKAQRAKKRADTAVRAAAGADTIQEGVINMWILNDWVKERGYRIDFNQWMNSVSAGELEIGIGELDIP